MNLARHAAGPDPRRQDAFVGEANTTSDEAEAAAERRRRAPLEAVYGLLKAGVPYSRFPADKRAALDPRDAEALAAGEANPPPKDGDPALLMQIRRLYAEADPGFRTLNPSDFANLLNPDQMGQLAGWLDDVRQNGANGPTPDQRRVDRSGAVTPANLPVWAKVSSTRRATRPRSRLQSSPPTVQSRRTFDRPCRRPQGRRPKAAILALQAPAGRARHRGRPLRQLACPWRRRRPPPQARARRVRADMAS